MWLYNLEPKARDCRGPTCEMNTCGSIADVLEKHACNKVALACAFKRNQVLSCVLLNVCTQVVVGY